tara:strand:- start:593 stop:880 length:288 start_codon:yes stop_codon:yes gene_type:complete
MDWSALDNKHQVYNNQPKIAFEKEQKAFRKRMKNAPTLNSSDPQLVTTNFDELLSIRKQNAQKKASANRRFMFFTGLTIIITIAIVLWETLRQLP